MRFVRTLAVALIIIGAVVSAYWSVSLNSFISMDDPMYVTDNTHVHEGLTWAGVRWAFTTIDVSNWHPLTWLSHMLDWQLFGERPAGHHWMSVGLHAANALLVLAALSMLTREFWPSAAAALLFALHPVRVESVAWVAERKDLLAAFFGLLCLVAYAWYVRRPGIARYLLVFITLALGLLAKPMLVTWPFLLLLLDFWPLRRASGTDGMPVPHSAEQSLPQASLRRLVLEKVPLLALSAASSVITMLAQKTGGAVMDADRLPMAARLGNAAVAYVRYLSVTVWPVDLSIIYPHPGFWSSWIVLCAIGLLVSLSMGCVMLRRRAPWLLIGWLWFLGMLVPVIGLVQVGVQSMADRYMYLPQLGLIIAVVWSAWRCCGTGVTASITLLAAILLWIVTQHQVRLWHDSRTLFEHSLAVTRDNWVIERVLGLMASQRDDIVEAERHQREAVRIRPQSPMLLADLADVLARNGDFREAIPILERAVALEPDNGPLVNNLAWLLATSADPGLRNGSRAVQLAERLVAMTDVDEAEYPTCLDTLSAAYAAANRFQDALDTGSRALDISIQRNRSDLTPLIVAHLRRYEQHQIAE